MTTPAIQPSDVTPNTSGSDAAASNAASNNTSTTEMLDNLIAMINTIIQSLQKIQEAEYQQQQKQSDMQKTSAVLGKKAAQDKLEKIKEYLDALAEAKKYGFLAPLVEALAVTFAVAFAVCTFGAGTAAAVAAVSVTFAVLESVPETKEGMDNISCGSGVTKDITGAVFKTAIAGVLTMGAGSVATSVDVAAETATARAASSAAEDGGAAAAKAAEENANKFNEASKSFAQRSTFATSFVGMNPMQNLANIGLRAAGKQDDPQAQMIAGLIVTLLNLVVALYTLKGAGTAGKGQLLTKGAGMSDGVYNGLVWGNRAVAAGNAAVGCVNGYQTYQIGLAQKAVNDVDGLMSLLQGSQMMSEKTMSMLQTVLDNACKQMGQILENTQAYALFETAEADVLLGRKA